MYQAKLHAGEVEVMILAQESPGADLVILDDNAAKKTAKFLGLKVTGTNKVSGRRGALRGCGSGIALTETRLQTRLTSLFA